MTRAQGGKNRLFGSPAQRAAPPMTAAELRARLEDAGASLSVVNRRLRVLAPPGLLTHELRSEIRRLHGALVAHKQAWPCPGCGRSPWARSSRCARCVGGIGR